MVAAFPRAGPRLIARQPVNQTLVLFEYLRTDPTGCSYRTESAKSARLVVVELSGLLTFVRGKVAVRKVREWDAAGGGGGCSCRWRGGVPSLAARSTLESCRWSSTNNPFGGGV
jgi:hypothetical protein